MRTASGARAGAGCWCRCWWCRSAGCCSPAWVATRASIPSPLIGKPMPAFAGTTLEGGEGSSSPPWPGSPAVINFWATYCVPCRRLSTGLLLDLRRAHGDELSVVGVLVQTTRPDAARDFLARYGRRLADAHRRRRPIALDLGVTGPPGDILRRRRGHRPLPPRRAADRPPWCAEQLAALGVDAVRRWLLPLAVAALLALGGLVLVRCCSRRRRPPPTEQAQQLAAELRCPDCQALSVAESQTAAAAAIRAEIAEQLAAGRSGRGPRSISWPATGNGSCCSRPIR